MSRQKLESRIVAFHEGRWMELLRDSTVAAETAHTQSVRRRRRQDHDDDARRAARAMTLTQMGELSVARQALEGAPVAPGTMSTLSRKATASAKSTSEPRGGRSSFHRVPHLSQKGTPRCCGRSVRHDIRPPLPCLLENESDPEMLCRVASLLSVEQVPETILEAIRLGRMTALSKPDGGGVRGIVVGDVLRRLVARTIAKQVIEKVEAATAPFQYALSTKAGCECVAHVLQTLTDLDPEATIMSIDGVGAYDLISRGAVLEGLLRMEGGDQILPFVRCFHGSPSTYLWEDEMGTTQHTPQGEGGEQGDPLMPLLFALGQHRALEAIHENMRPGEHVMAFLDDIYTACRPERLDEVHTTVDEQLATHAHIHVHHGKTPSVEQRWRRTEWDRGDDQGCTSVET